MQEILQLSIRINIKIPLNFTVKQQDNRGAWLPLPVELVILNFRVESEPHIVGWSLLNFFKIKNQNTG